MTQQQKVLSMLFVSTIFFYFIFKFNIFLTFFLDCILLGCYIFIKSFFEALSYNQESRMDEIKAYQKKINEIKEMLAQESVNSLRTKNDTSTTINDVCFSE